ncbi:MAG: hypothetical protein J6Y02_14575 [Pseudobutyrivibrio sp.]|nr:hypothetical protein [Pseudobutyrivibrio sp.]
MLKLGEFLKVFKESENGVSTYPIVEFCSAIDIIKLHIVGNDPNTAIATTFDYYIGVQKDGRKISFDNMKDFSEYIATYHNDYSEILQLIHGLDKGTVSYRDEMLYHFTYATALDVAPSTRMFHMGFVLNAIMTTKGVNTNETLQILVSKLCDFAISYINMNTDVYLYLSEIGKAGK